MINIILPYPPSVNHYKSVGRIIKTKSGKRYQQKINSPETKRYFFEVWMIVKKMEIEIITQPIELKLLVYPPDKRKRDLDNIFKLCLDSLQHAGLFEDDYQIRKLSAERMEIISNGQIIVDVSTTF